MAILLCHFAIFFLLFSLISPSKMISPLSFPSIIKFNISHYQKLLTATISPTLNRKLKFSNIYDEEFC